MATQAQILASIAPLRAEILAALVPGANLSGPSLAALLVRGLDNLTDEVRRSGTSRYGAGVPAAGLGADNDVYTDNGTGFEYLKVGGAWVFQLNKKGAPGRTPVKGVDFQDGEDGIDGSRLSVSANAPTGGADGDAHFQTLGAERYRIYANAGGVWAITYTTPETVDLFGWPATEVAKITNQANWDSEGNYTGPLLVGISFPKFYGFKSQSPSIPSAIFMAAADNVVLRSVCM